MVRNTNFTQENHVEGKKIYWRHRKLFLAKRLLPTKSLLQAVDGLAGGLQDPLSVPDPDFPGSSLGTDGADGEQLAVSSPRDPRPAIIPGRSWLHPLWARFHTNQNKLVS